MGPVGVAEPPLKELTSLQTNVKVLSDSACTPSVILCRPLEFDRVGVPLPTGVNARLELFGEQSRKKRCFPCNSSAHSIENVLFPTGVWLGKPLLNGPAAERATLTIDLAQVRSQCSHSFLRALPPIGSLASARADLHIANVPFCNSQVYQVWRLSFSTAWTHAPLRWAIALSKDNASYSDKWLTFAESKEGCQSAFGLGNAADAWPPADGTLDDKTNVCFYGLINIHEPSKKLVLKIWTR